VIELRCEPRRLCARAPRGRGHIERDNFHAAEKDGVIPMALNAGEVLQIIRDSFCIFTANLVISECGQLQNLVFSPQRGFITKDLPVGIV
jgi:hypothetical protein